MIAEVLRLKLHRHTRLAVAGKPDSIGGLSPTLPLGTLSSAIADRVDRIVHGQRPARKAQVRLP